jgi:hypothetical protein
MSTIKIIAGIIIGFFSFVTLIQMVGEERGAGLVGVFIGFLLVAGFSVWLINSGLNGNKKRNRK